MNLLIDDLPTTVEVNGKEYPINSDFRSCLRVIMAFEDEGLTGYEKQMIMLVNLYPKIPNDVTEAMRQASLFLNGGKESKEESQHRLYSFSKDANLIFAAFRQTHNIDLESERLHWWKFMALFMDLGAETTFCQLVGLRKRYKAGRATKEEKRAIMEMGDLFDIPEVDERTIEQMEAERRYDEAVAEGERMRANGR